MSTMSGTDVRAVRCLLHWTQQELADALGLRNKSQASRIETGQRMLTYCERNELLRCVKEAQLPPKERRIALTFFADGAKKVQLTS